MADRGGASGVRTPEQVRAEILRRAGPASPAGIARFRKHLDELRAIAGGVKR